MAKHKKGKVLPLKSNEFGPEKYIKTQARSLPIYECIISADWRDVGICNIIVARQHKTGNITAGVFLVDMYCLGVKDAGYYFNLTPDEYEEIKYELPEYEECEYVLAHNLIFGALEYADDYGFEPHKEFALVKYILEEDDENVALMDLDFGLDGKPCYVSGPFEDKVSVNKVLATLKRTAGEGNFIYMDSSEFADLADEEWDDDELDDFLDEEEEDDFEEDDEYEWEKIGFKNLAKGYKKIYSAYHNFIRTAEARQMLEESPIGKDYKLSKEVIQSAYNSFDSKEQENELYALYAMIFEDNDYANAIKGLKKAIKKYPHKAVFYNILRSAYVLNNEMESAIAIATEAYELFPDDLLIKTNYANVLFDAGKSEKVLAVFDNKRDLNEIYPGVKKFNRTEVSGYYVCMCRYYLDMDDVDKADLYMNVLLQKNLYDEHTLDMVKQAVAQNTKLKLEKIADYQKNGGTF